MPVFALNSRAARAAIDGTQAALRSPASPWWSWPELDAYRRAARAPLARALFRRQDVAGAHACVPSRLPSVYPRRRAAGRRASFRLSLGQLPFPLSGDAGRASTCLLRPFDLATYHLSTILYLAKSTAHPRGSWIEPTLLYSIDWYQRCRWIFSFHVATCSILGLYGPLWPD